MRRMYGEERHISVLKAELENFIEDEEEDNVKKTTDFAEDIIKTKMMYTKKSHGRDLKNRPHFRPISEKNKKNDNDTLKVKPLETSTQKSKVNSTESGNVTDVTSNETLSDEKSISYKTKLESIANIEINNLEPDVITLEAVIKQSIETNSIYPNTSGTGKSEPTSTSTKNATATETNITTTATESIPNSTESTTTDTQYDDTTTESGKDAGWKPMNADTSTLPPTLLFSEHEKVKIDRIDTKVNEEKIEFHPKPTVHQESVRPSVIKLRGA